jgi:hypothetical protein
MYYKTHSFETIWGQIGPAKVRHWGHFRVPLYYKKVSCEAVFRKKHWARMSCKCWILEVWFGRRRWNRSMLRLPFEKNNNSIDCLYLSYWFERSCVRKIKLDIGKKSDSILLEAIRGSPKKFMGCLIATPERRSLWKNVLRKQLILKELNILNKIHKKRCKEFRNLVSLRRLKSGGYLGENLAEWLGVCLQFGR